MSGIDKYTQPWSVTFNSSNALANNTVLTCSFKDAAGNPTRAKEIYIRITAADAWDGKVHVRFNNISSGTAVANTNFFLRAEDNIRTIKFFCSEISILNIDAALGSVIWIDAYSDEDITGSTFA